MKRFIFTAVISFIVLMQECSAECEPFTICKKARDTLELLPGASQYDTPNDELSWFIQPTEPFTSILLVFQGFKGTLSVKVLTINNDNSLVFDTYTGSEEGRSFDVLLDDVREVIIFANNAEENTFKLNYYSDCQKINEGYLQYPSQFGSVADNKCWIVNFTLETGDLMRRLMMIARDVQLDDSYNLQFYDAITSDLVAEIGGNREYDVFGFDTITSRTMIIQLECTKPGMCSPTPHNSFHLNVYSMNERGIACAELQRQCSQLSEEQQPGLCHTSCPVLEQMIQDEIMFEENSPTIRGGYVRQRSRGYSAKMSPMKSSQAATDANKGKKKRRCPLAPKYCKCDMRSRDLKRFCYLRGKCFEHDNCTWGCIVTRMTACAKIRRLQTIKLL